MIVFCLGMAVSLDYYCMDFFNFVLMIDLGARSFKLRSSKVSSLLFSRGAKSVFVWERMLGMEVVLLV